MKKLNQNVTTVGATSSRPTPQRHDPKNQNGITLIALVITIIILLILAGVTLAMLTGEEGIIKSAKEAEIETRGASVEEQRDIWLAERYVQKTVGAQQKTMDAILDELLANGLLSAEEVEIIKNDENNEITIGSKTISFKVDDSGSTGGGTQSQDKEKPIIITELSYSNPTETSFTLNLTAQDTVSGLNKIEWYYKVSTEEYTKVTEEFATTTEEVIKTKDITGLKAGTYKAYALIYDAAGNTKQTQDIEITLTALLARQVSVGDYVAYDATDNYTYTSPVGTGSSHGNGHSEQTITSSSSIKWKVFSSNPTTGEVVLVSDGSVSPVSGADFYISGAVGYLYSEEELNRGCAVYGYGTGADISKTFTCQTGDTLEGLSTVTLTGSGARSIKMEDINDFCGVTVPDDVRFMHGNANYFGTFSPYSANYSICYPTTKTTIGYSTSTAVKKYIITHYYYYADDFLSEDSVEYNVLFNSAYWSGVYWTASRAVDSPGNYTEFYTSVVAGNNIGNFSCVIGGRDYFQDNVICYPVKPMVYLKTTVETSGKDETGAWTIIDK